MDNPAASASATNCLCSSGVTLSATGLLRLSFAFFGGRPILALRLPIPAYYFSYTNKSNGKFCDSSFQSFGIRFGLFETRGHMVS